MAAQATVEFGEYTITGPYSHENLSVYLVTGADAMEAVRFLTLQEALDQKKAVVHETGDVNQVVIENLSEDEAVFVQSGDIVKGGRQDRAFRFDVVVQPKAQVPVTAYCVERRRWRQRGGEDVDTFSGADATLSTAVMKTTVIRGLSQKDLWGDVDETQEMLSRSLGDDVRSEESPSSYQLTSESELVRAAVEEYVGALSEVAAGEGVNVLGSAVAINGALNRADLYVAGSLFTKLWPKLLRSASEAAIARRREPQEGAEADRAEKIAPPPLDAVRTYLEESRKGDASEEVVADGVRATTVVSGDTTFYESRVLKPTDTWVHQGYLTAAAEPVR